MKWAGRFTFILYFVIKLIAGALAFVPSYRPACFYLPPLLSPDMLNTAGSLLMKFEIHPGPSPLPLVCREVAYSQHREEKLPPPPQSSPPPTMPLCLPAPLIYLTWGFLDSFCRVPVCGGIRLSRSLRCEPCFGAGSSVSFIVAGLPASRVVFA